MSTKLCSNGSTILIQAAGHCPPGSLNGGGSATGCGSPLAMELQPSLKHRAPSVPWRVNCQKNRWRNEETVVARVLMIAYTTYMHDGRVKRHAEALAERGDHLDVICLAGTEPPVANGVNVIGLKMPRYRGSSKAAYVRSYVRFFVMASVMAARLSLKRRYDVVIVCTMPDAVIVCA